MKAIVDECLHQSTASLLREYGLNILYIGDILQWGATDEAIFQHASKNNIPLFTHDKRFGKIYYDTFDTPPTVIVVQVISPHPKATNELLKSALDNIDFFSERYANKLILISRNRIRIRSKSEL